MFDPIPHKMAVQAEAEWGSGRVRERERKEAAAINVLLA